MSFRWGLFIVASIFVDAIVGAQSTQIRSPNVLFILVDDLAWSDLGCYGHPWHETPHIDRLAASGIRLTNAYAPAPICSASRASILTGKTTARLGFEFVTKNQPGRQTPTEAMPLRTPPFTLDLPLAERTIAERVKELGYKTAYFGKWHLNAHHNGYLGWSPTHGPKKQGFDLAVQDFGGHPYSWKKSPPESIRTDCVFPGDSMVDRVCDFVGQSHSRPYFAMASTFYVHTPVKTPCVWLVDKYEKRIPVDVRNRERRIEYAAFVETLDHYVGRMLDSLKSSGAKNETLVVFMSDNGGHPEYAANGPLRGSKWNLFEGGIRVPMIATWPNGIAAGMTNDAVVIGYDWLPTCVALAGGTADDVDGVDLSSLLTKSVPLPTRNLLWHFPYYHPERRFAAAVDAIGVNDFQVSKTRPQSALRRGDHKAIWFAEENRVEVFDLKDDLSEQRPLSDSSIIAQLKRELFHELQSAGARLAK